jgi:hypothetical protein
MLQALLVFAAMFSLDLIWARYTYALTKRQPLGSSISAVGIVFANSVVTLGYVSDPWMILPAALGAFTGTWVAVRFERQSTPTTFKVPTGERNGKM